MLEKSFSCLFNAHHVYMFRWYVLLNILVVAKEDSRTLLGWEIIRCFSPEATFETLFRKKNSCPALIHCHVLGTKYNLSCVLLERKNIN